MVDFDKIISLVKKIENLSNDKDLAALFGLSAQNFSKKKKAGTLLRTIIDWGIAKKG